MIATGSVAFANARVRAIKSRLLGHEIAGRVRAGLAATRDDRLARGFDGLIASYVTVLKSYPRGQTLFLALLRRHEIENVKLMWRVIVNSAFESRWARHWLDLERLAAISLESCRECRTLPSLIDALRGTPYAAVAGEMWRAHAGDAAAAELGFDRWTSACIVDAAAALPHGDRTAAEIAFAVVELAPGERLRVAGIDEQLAHVR